MIKLFQSRWATIEVDRIEKTADGFRVNIDGRFSLCSLGSRPLMRDYFIPRLAVKSITNPKIGRKTITALRSVLKRKGLI